MITKKVIVFDLDDTLVNGQVFCGEVMVRTISKYHKDVQRIDILAHDESIRGRTILDLYQSAKEKFGLTPSVEELVATDSAIMLKDCFLIKPFEGVRETLATLKAKGKKLVICTNRKSESLSAILKHNDLLSYFDKVISCVDVGYEKPDPKCLNDLVKRFKLPKSAFLYFGDSEKDYVFAKNAGIECLILDQYLNKGRMFNNLNSTFLPMV